MQTIPKHGEKKTGRVKPIQQFLVDEGFGDIVGKPDDWWGDNTTKALKAWQAKYFADGTLDEDEYSLLLRLIEQRKESAKPSSESEFAPVLDGQAAVIERYGKPWEDSKAWWTKWGAAAQLPDDFEHLGVRRNQIWVNRDIKGPIEAAFNQIADEGLARKVETFDGCFCIRSVRGYEGSETKRWSTHTWALAIDINAATNQLGQPSTLHDGIVRAFCDHGFIWGGRFKRVDAMHFQRVKGF